MARMHKVPVEIYRIKDLFLEDPTDCTTFYARRVFQWRVPIAESCMRRAFLSHAPQICSIVNTPRMVLPLSH